MKSMLVVSDSVFDAATFHEKVDNLGPTITVVLTAQNNIIGGYTSVPMTSPEEDTPLEDDKAFIFSIGEDGVLKIYKQHANQDRAIVHNVRYLVHFGMFDFYLHDNCNEGDKNTANVGHTYTIQGDDTSENWNILDKVDEHFGV